MSRVTLLTTIAAALLLAACGEEPEERLPSYQRDEGIAAYRAAGASLRLAVPIGRSPELLPARVSESESTVTVAVPVRYRGNAELLVLEPVQCVEIRLKRPVADRTIISKRRPVIDIERPPKRSLRHETAARVLAAGAPCRKLRVTHIPAR